ncbi:hypothetical protein [Polynucleobacter sp. UK-Kesae-W10]|uniref:hypothetical protein n=1 Tax=Polynucleobacter sp. UK-Kesae-W10 TaxID=1819738 RepID=UPI001C0D75AF|nr:hypothetical protein [Polynucleobacter sp. UK-Kesae-W10]MBU3577490.1 hypothetical protein [Polynucleobacter sp. UK-Kesae-W10]
MLNFLLLIYALSAAVVGWHFWKTCLCDESYITLKEAMQYALVVTIPGFNTILACAILWEAIDDVVIWRRKNDKA